VNVIEENKTYTVEYPFCRDKVSVPPDDEDGDFCEIDTWRPGTKYVDGPDACTEDTYVISVADAMGKMHLSVVSIHRPGKFPTRVFFTRQWQDPDGKTFGKGKLHVTTQQAFTRLLRGYRHEYELSR
jgi:hypothetical protein